MFFPQKFRISDFCEKFRKKMCVLSFAIIRMNQNSAFLGSSEQTQGNSGEILVSENLEFRLHRDPFRQFSSSAEYSFLAGKLNPRPNDPFRDSDD